MYDDDEPNVALLFLSIVVVGIAIFAILAIVFNWFPGGLTYDQSCKRDFGKDYYYVDGHFSKSICTNSEGDVRYPNGY